MFCSKCKKEVAEGAAFCSHCGERLETQEKETRRCTCGRELEARAKFCPNCGLAVTGTADDSAKIEGHSGISGGKPHEPEANRKLPDREPPAQKQRAKVLPIQEFPGKKTPPSEDKLKGSAKKPARLKKIFTASTAVLLAAALIAAGVLYMRPRPTLSPEEAMAAIAETASKYPGDGMNIISAGDAYTVGLKKDGTVIAVGTNQYDVRNVSGFFSRWQDIVAVSAGDITTVGLKKDGTVVASGFMADSVKGWTDMAGVISDEWGVAGFKNDGTVICADSRSVYEGCEEWTDIIAITRFDEGIIGLKKDGTIVAAGKYEKEVSRFKDIVAISSGYKSCFGLRKDGTVALIAVGRDSFQDVKKWNKIVSISAGGSGSEHASDHIVGLKSDGAVVASGVNKYGECDVSGWTDIVAVSTGYDHTVGLKKDGTVVAAGNNANGQCDASKWSGIAEVSMDWYRVNQAAKSGNTGGNIANYGFVAEEDNWVYIIQSTAPQMRGGSLYKMRPDGSEKILLTDRATAYINVEDDWVYYQNGADNFNIYKVRTDGTGCTKLNDDECWNINVYDGWIYYNNYSDNQKIYKMRTDGTEETKLSDIRSDIYVADGWIYAGTCKIRTDGTEETDLGKDSALDINVVDGWIYYIKSSDDKIYKMRTDGTERTKLCDDSSSCLNVWDGWIYYWKGPGAGQLYKIDIDGKNRTRVSGDDAIYINVVESGIYFINRSDNEFMYRIDADGSSRQKVDLWN